MKALSVVKPAGSHIANGVKTVEIRRWYPDLTLGEAILLVENENFLLQEGQQELGMAVAILTIGEIRSFELDDIPAACATSIEQGWLAFKNNTVKKGLRPFTALAARRLYNSGPCLIAPADCVTVS